MKLSSRRNVLSLVSAIPAALGCRLANPQRRLLELGKRFDALSAQVDAAIENGGDLDWPTIVNLDHVARDIATTSVVTIDDLTIKAKVACWARLGDLDVETDTTMDQYIALSIIRDLIRREDVGLEKPGALKKLLQT